MMKASDAQGQSGYLRPIPTLLNWLTISLFGRSALAFHAMNLCLHLGALFFAYRLCRCLGLRVLEAFFVLAIFTFHPMQVETLAFISCRPELCAGLFVFMTLWGYDQYRHKEKTAWLALSLVSFSLGLLSKEIVLGVVPVVLWLETVHYTRRAWGGATVIFGIALTFICLRLIWAPGVETDQFTGRKQN